MANLPNERALSNMILSRLSPFFNIKEEVKGILTTPNGIKEKYRIDAVIAPKDVSEWKNKNIAFGIEFKSIEVSEKMKGIAKLYAQAYNYQFVDWEGFGKIQILICPPINTGNPETDSYLKRIMAYHNLGELGSIHSRKYLAILYNETHRIWSENYGVSEGKYRNFETR